MFIIKSIEIFACDVVFWCVKCNVSIFKIEYYTSIYKSSDLFMWLGRLFFYTSPKCTNNLLFVCWMKTPHGYWDDTWLTQIPMFNYMSIDWSTGCDERYCFILMLTQLTLSLWLLMDGLRIISCFYPIHEMYEIHMTQIIWYMVESHSNAEFLFK